MPPLAYATSGGGGFLPGSPNQYDPAYGGIPRVPSPTSTQSTSIAGNLSNIGNLYNLATGTGGASGAGVISALNQEIPGISGTIGTATGNINELLSGQVPQDVITQLRQQSAEIGAGSGMGPMSPFSNASYLRSLGLTSLGMKEKGQSELDSLMGSVPRAPAFDPSSMLVNPNQAQEWAYLAQVLGNAPVPSAAAKANLDALKFGAGYGGGGPVGGFNTPVRGGPAFATPPISGPEDTGYPTVPMYGGTGSPDQYGGDPTAGAYDRWRGMMPGMSQEDIYNLGLSPATEEGAAGDPYFDPNSMDAMYGY